MLDKIEASLADGSKAPVPRFLPKLDESEEVAHFRETIRRWESKTGKRLRAVIEPFKAEVARRKPGDAPFHPEFHKNFSAAIDQLIATEVEEMRERRNLAIHEKAKQVFDAYRESNPDLVGQYEKELSQPQYAVPAGASDGTPAAKSTEPETRPAKGPSS